MRDHDARVTIHRRDYRAPEFQVEHADLDFDIGAETTRVNARLSIRHNPKSPKGPLHLDGIDLELQRIALNGAELDDSAYRIVGEELIVDPVPEAFELETISLIHPASNTALEGLYQAGDNLLTQCEAEGFRKITWFVDRPDVMARYRVRIEADREQFPVLLCNGNCLEQGELDNGRHYSIWEDPFPKPSYLFALVAGNLEFVEEHFLTREGRQVALKLYAESENMDKVDHAMASLKRAMVWDEQRFSLSYDLDVYHIVATNDFNMGAMENKSLNIFNAKFVLARPETATDADFMAIEGVIGHEYFHNWTGNRVTCRDWFQLSLKEGLTVFRDQEFSSDLHSRAVKRINDVRMLRSHQFSEDAGPMAHPVRPDSYIEINNFYTLTVYEKGSEVVRMYHTLLGEDGFQSGMKLYFQRHDGQAVTCDDFRAAMARANDVDLEHFGRWYAQAGTPVVEASGVYDAHQRRYTLTLSQHTPPSPGQAQKQPLLMPVRLGLIGANGQDMPLRLRVGELIGDGDVVVFDRAQQTFEFEDLDTEPVPSLFRGFSAPVIAKIPYSREQLGFLMAHDSDSFNRWDAVQRLSTEIILEQADALKSGHSIPIPNLFLEAMRDVLAARKADLALTAEALILPDEIYLAEQRSPVDVEEIHRARQSVRQAVARHLEAELEAAYLSLMDTTYSLEPLAIARRSLRNVCLSLMNSLAGESGFDHARRQYANADNMTDSLSALTALVHNAAPDADASLDQFRTRWHLDPLVMDKWLSLQAASPGAETLARVKALMDDPVFSLRNPNKVRSLIGVFSRLNPIGFHARDGQGYSFVADQVLAVDRLNPQVASRLVGAFNGWFRFDENRQKLMRVQIERIVAEPTLSKHVFEISTKALAMSAE